MLAADYRNVARNSLKGFWGITLVITVIAILLGGASLGSDSAVSLDYNTSINNYVDFGQMYHNSVYSNLPGFLYNTKIALSFVSFLVYAVITLFVGPFISLGYNLYTMRLVNGEGQNGFETLFERSGILFKALGLVLVTALFVFLWSLLLVIPGIIAAYSYSMAPYIMAENPEIGIMDALSLSKQYMYGHKWRLFCLHISFIGWSIVASIVPVIGPIVLYPYRQTAEAAFYLHLTGKLMRGPVYE